MKNILNNAVDAFLTVILCIAFPMATLFGKLAGLCCLVHRKLKTAVVILFCLMAYMTLTDILSGF